MGLLLENVPVVDLDAKLEAGRRRGNQWLKSVSRVGPSVKP